MTLIDIAKALGKLQAAIEATGAHIAVVDAAAGVVTALVNHAHSHPADLSADDVRVHIDAAKAEALAAGDEAQARIDARKEQL